MPPGIGPLVSRQQGACGSGLVAHHGHIFAIAHHDKAAFFALQKLFNHHARAAVVVGDAQGVEVGVGCEHEFDGFVRFVQRHGHHHALAGGQAVGLDDDGRALFIHVGVGRRRIGEGFIFGGGNAVSLHKGLGKSLGAFQLGSCLGRAKNPQAMRAKFIHDAGC